MMIRNSFVVSVMVVLVGCAFAHSDMLVDIVLHRPAERAEYPACCEIIATLHYSDVSVCFQNAMDCPGIYVCADMLCASPGDLDGDSDVDLVDFATFQNAWTGPL